MYHLVSKHYPITWPRGTIIKALLLTAEPVGLSYPGTSSRTVSVGSQMVNCLSNGFSNVCICFLFKSAELWRSLFGEHQVFFVGPLVPRFFDLWWHLPLVSNQDGWLGVLVTCVCLLPQIHIPSVTPAHNSGRPMVHVIYFSEQK